MTNTRIAHAIAALGVVGLVACGGSSRGPAGPALAAQTAPGDASGGEAGSADEPAAARTTDWRAQAQDQPLVTVGGADDAPSCEAVADHALDIIAREMQGAEFEKMLDALPEAERDQIRQTMLAQMERARGDIIRECGRVATPAMRRCVMEAESFEGFGECDRLHGEDADKDP